MLPEDQWVLPPTSNWLIATWLAILTGLRVYIFISLKSSYTRALDFRKHYGLIIVQRDRVKAVVVF